MDEIKTLIEIIKQRSQQFKEQSNAVELISSRYGIQEEDAAKWLSVTEWESSNDLTGDIIQNVQETLMNLGVIHKKRDFDEFCMSL